MSYPNQLIIQCIPEERKRNERYGSLSRKAEIVAARLLNDGSASHIVFLHFALHKKDHKYELSKKELEKYLGISEKQYRKAIDVLKEKGYMVQRTPTSNIYYFKRIPDQYKDMDILDIITSSNQKNAPASKRNDTLRENDIALQGGNFDLQDENNAVEVHRNKTNITNNTVIETATNDTFAVDLPTEENEDIAMIFSKKEEQENFHNSDVGYKFKAKYQSQLKSAQWCNTADGIKIERILKKYLSTHRESDELKRLGDKYGRIVNGWDSEKQTPIIVYATSFLTKAQMKHNIDGIPKEYYI